MQNKLKEQEEKEKNRKKREAAKIKDDYENIKNEMMLKLINKYPEFFDSASPYKVVSFRNGQLIPHNTQINIKAGLFPLTLEEIFAACKLWLFEFSATAAFEENQYDRQEIQIKYQILPYTGNFYKFAAAFGFTACNSALRNSSFLDAELLVSPFIAGNVTLIDLHFSFASLYADMGKACVGINNYLFYKQLKDRLSVILELNYIFNEFLRNCHNDPLVFQPAVKFKTTDNLFSTFSYEDNRYFIISIEIGF